MWVALRYTESRGRSAVPLTFALTRRLRLIRDMDLFLVLIIVGGYAAEPVLAALPALRRICSSTYLMPLPLYGSGFLMRRICEAVSPTSCLSMPLTVMMFFSTVTAVPSG